MSEAFDEDDYLDGLGLERPDPGDDEEAAPLAAEADEVDPSLPRIEESREAPEPERVDPEPEPEASSKEPEAPQDPAEPVAAESTKPDDGESVEALKARAEAAEKMAAARLAELSRVRKQNAENARQAAQLEAPKPTTTPEIEGPTDDGMRIPVQVDAEGNQVYMDLSDPKVREFVRREAAQATAPSPEQVAQQERAQMVAAFVAENPDRNQRIAQDIVQADQFIGQALTAALHDYGTSPQTMDELMFVAEQSGVTAKVRELYPEIAPHMRNLVAAIDSGDVNFIRMVMDTISTGYDAAPAAPAVPSKPLQSVENAPRSLARTGGERVVSSDADDQREFADLDKRYQADPFSGITNEEHARWRELGRKLDKPGFDRESGGI